MPELTANDVVYTAGAPAMTEAIAKLAKAAGARCYTDPFVSHGSHSSGPGLMSKLTGWLDSSRSNGMLQPMQAGAGSRLSI